MPAHPTRRLARRSAVVLGATTCLLLATSPGAIAQTTTTERVAATQASALLLTLNLPQGNRLQLQISATSGTITAVTGKGPEAEALATVLRGSLADQELAFPGAEARLPEPLKASGPTSALSEGIAGTPLAEFLSLGVAESTAEVTAGPSSTSSASLANLSLGLPAALAEVLAQVLDPLLAGLDMIIEGLEPADAATTAICDAIVPVTEPVVGGVGAIPVFGPILGEVITDVTNQDAGVLCTLRTRLGAFVDDLGASLLDLAGPGGLLNTGLITSTQSITTSGTTTTATSTGRVAGLRILGQNPFGDVLALETTSTATLAGNDATATTDTTGVDVDALPLLGLTTDLQTITGDLTGISLDGLTELLAQLQVILDGLAGIGISAGNLDPAGADLTACPEALSGTLSGTFEQDGAAGACAAAAARGYGLAVTVPEALAGPLGIEGELLSLQFAPTGALVQGRSTTSAPPMASPDQLPRTGAGGAVAGLAGLALIGSAALLRRRRTAALV